MSAILAGQVVQSGFKTTQKLSSDTFSFDFPSLITKLIVFYLVAYAIAKVFEAIIFGNNVLKSILSLVGLNLPNTMPEAVVNFFTDGFKGVKYWDIVKVLSILLVIMEWNNWQQTQKALKINPSPMTQGVFAVLIAGLTLITVPELVQRLRELKAMQVSV